MRKLLITLLLTMALVLMGCSSSEPEKELIDSQDMGVAVGEPNPSAPTEKDSMDESTDDASEMVESTMPAEGITPVDEMIAEEEAVETEEELDAIVESGEEADQLDSDLDALFE